MSEYRYNDDDKEIGRWRKNFTSRIGDGTGHHAADYLDILKLLINLNQGGSFLDIGCGLGRVILFAAGEMAEIVGLEPDSVRFKKCCERVYKEYDVPNCQILNQMSPVYIADNPGKTFDLVVLSMVIQHVSTDVCKSLIEDTYSLVRPDGVAIISTSHTAESAQGFSYQNPAPDEFYISEEEYNKYAKSSLLQGKGVPMRRFSRTEFLACISSHFDVLLWRQFSYIRPEKLFWLANQLQVPPEELRDVAESQFAVLRKKLSPQSGAFASG